MPRTETRKKAIEEQSENKQSRKAQRVQKATQGAAVNVGKVNERPTLKSAEETRPDLDAVSSSGQREPSAQPSSDLGEVEEAQAKTASSHATEEPTLKQVAEDLNEIKQQLNAQERRGKGGRPRKSNINREPGGKNGLQIGWERFTVTAKTDVVERLKNYAYTERLTVKQAFEKLITQALDAYPGTILERPKDN